MIQQAPQLRSRVWIPSPVNLVTLVALPTKLDVSSDLTDLHSNMVTTEKHGCSWASTRKSADLNFMGARRGSASLSGAHRRLASLEVRRVQGTDPQPSRCSAACYCDELSETA